MPTNVGSTASITITYVSEPQSLPSEDVTTQNMNVKILVRYPYNFSLRETPPELHVPAYYPYNTRYMRTLLWYRKWAKGLLRT
jgi:hypothetical protein